MQELERRAAGVQSGTETTYTPSESGSLTTITWTGRPPLSNSNDAARVLASVSKCFPLIEGRSPPSDSETPDLCPSISVERNTPPQKAFRTPLGYDMSDPYFYSRRQIQSTSHFPEEEREKEISSPKALNVTFTPSTSYDTSPDFSPSYSAPYLANCYVNHITMTQLSFVNGFHINAIQIGIQPHEICDDTESRFYRPGLSASPYKDVLVESIRCSFSNLTTDLRPSEAQITISHNPYIDVIPFPSVRERMIRLAISPCSTPVSPSSELAFDEDELCDDMAKGGLVCWGYVDAARYGGMEGGTGGNPWEKESWEAMEWFLEKWRGIVGNEDEKGGLWEISRGWRTRRGEDIVV